MRWGRKRWYTPAVCCLDGDTRRRRRRSVGVHLTAALDADAETELALALEMVDLTGEGDTERRGETGLVHAADFAGSVNRGTEDSHAESVSGTEGSLSVALSANSNGLEVGGKVDLVAELVEVHGLSRTLGSEAEESRPVAGARELGNVAGGHILEVATGSLVDSFETKGKVSCERLKVVDHVDTTAVGGRWVDSSDERRVIATLVVVVDLGERLAGLVAEGSLHFGGVAGNPAVVRLDVYVEAVVNTGNKEVLHLKKRVKECE